MEKGVDVLLRALKELQPGKVFSGFIVGGPDGDRLAYEQQADSLGLSGDEVLFTGEISARDVPAALAACDILAMPFPDFPHYRSNMSPLKMFEYMAADRPVVTSDLPTIRDVLSEDSAVFCIPGDAHSLAQVLLWISGHPEEAEGKAHRAKELVSARYSWEERMRRILAAARLQP
jgi:glycosyltransferase involved in cell wall biosynthesis